MLNSVIRADVWSVQLNLKSVVRHTEYMKVNIRPAGDRETVKKKTEFTNFEISGAKAVNRYETTN